jgi:hypothetical protein
VGDETRTTACVTPRQYPQGDDVGDGIDWHPQADVDVGIDAVVGIVLMPRRLRCGPAGLLHQNVLAVEARTSRSHQVGGDPRQRTREGGTSVFRNSAPVDVVVEEATEAAALVVACVYRSHSTSTWSRVVVRPGARRGHVGVDAALEGCEDLVGEDPSQDDESVRWYASDVVSFTNMPSIKYYGGAKKCPNFNWRELGSLRFSVLFSCADQNNINFTTAPMEMNHYEVLEISRDAELIDIKKAYRRLALK